MCIVSKEAGLPTGKVAEETSDRNQSKIRRLELGNTHFEVQKPLLLQEGETYKPSIGSEPINEEHIEEIPSATFLPSK